MPGSKPSFPISAGSAFDPANGFCPTDAHVRVAIGLDSLGAAPVRGMRYGTRRGNACEVAIKVGAIRPTRPSHHCRRADGCRYNHRARGSTESMTYCGGILVREGLVMFADTRTNAGVDNISTFRKLHVFKDPKKRVMAIATAGNLSISQSVVSILTEGYDNPETGERETLMNSPTMFQAAQRVGHVIRTIHATEGKALEASDVSSMYRSCSAARSWASGCGCS